MDPTASTPLIRNPLEAQPSPFAGSKIMVVDDQPINIRLLQRKLERHNFKVMVARTGYECLDLVKKEIPDLILLDVMMPEMDGIETCQRLKSDPRSESIPVIFITAKSTKEGKIEGLDAGAIDYITKPIDLDETLARVHTQLRFQQIFRENIDLQNRLSEARRKAAVGAITQGIAHNLNNLLGVVVGYLDLMKTGLQNPQLIERSVGLMDKAVGRVVDIVRQLSSLSDIDRIELTPIKLDRLIRKATERFAEHHKQMPLNADFVIAENLSEITLNANSEIFETILVALMHNAYEAYPSSHSGPRTVQIEFDVVDITDQRFCLIKVIDQGSGVEASVEDTLFEPFVSTKTHVGCGMGLSVARHSARSLGGDITLEPMPDGGTCACLRHPM
ncbi:MAG: response regulator [Opitutales bacterium]|nr:response regulator [Opitutales bacterium]NRA25655.1 response regulator [Opitutales bacterium]